MTKRDETRLAGHIFSSIFQTLESENSSMRSKEKLFSRKYLAEEILQHAARVVGLPAARTGIPRGHNPSVPSIPRNEFSPFPALPCLRRDSLTSSSGYSQK